MKTETDIDWREWEDWDEAVKKLNKLLKPHGVKLRNKTWELHDYLTVEAESKTPNQTEEK